MPLIAGHGHDEIAHNIREMLHSYHQTGKIGATTPKDAEHARRIAAAAAYHKAAETHPRHGGRKKKD